MSDNQTTQRASWSGKWAFILAAAGSAVGLGSMWRFPYLAAKYGGGTFLLVFLILVFTLGISLLILELAIGRKTQLSSIGAFSSLKRGWGVIGVIASVVPFIILPYYCVIGGWVTKYMVAYISAGPAPLADGGAYFSSFITSPVQSYVFLIIFALITLGIVTMGVKGGIEKINLVFMPLLIVIAIAISIYTLTIPGAVDGVKYFLAPDFSKLSPELILAAIGQVFFSLSVAMSIMITYGSYVKKEESLTASASRIVIFDVIISMLAGMMVIPGAYAALGSASEVATHSGPSLMFITLPTVFENMGSMATVVGVIFFLLVLFAAITSSISIAEACISILCDGLHITRKKAMAMLVIYTLIMGIFVNAGYNILSGIQPLGEGSSLLDLFDFVSNSVLMPVVAIGTCILVGWIIKPKVIIDEVRLSSPFKLARAWSVMVKYIAPILIAAVLVAFVLAQFGVIKL